eukprot:1702748-Amphidinium_carterae.1
MFVTITCATWKNLKGNRYRIALVSTRFVSMVFLQTLSLLTCHMYAPGSIALQIYSAPMVQNLVVLE